jgi:hypothetical protein
VFSDLGVLRREPFDTRPDTRNGVTWAEWATASWPHGVLATSAREAASHAMPANSTKRATVREPRPDFPPFPHATGRWTRKVRGKFVFFGSTAADPDGETALNKWLDQNDDLLAGVTPPEAKESRSASSPFWHCQVGRRFQGR